MSNEFKSTEVSNCEIDITFKGLKHFYQIPGNDGENIKEINIAYDTSSLDQVHLFDNNLEYLMTLSESERIPFLSSQRTSSSQQQKYLREQASRENRYKQIIKDINDKERSVNEAFSNSPSFEVLRIHNNKRDEVEAQNEFTRSLLSEENMSLDEHIEIEYPPNSIETSEPKVFKLERFQKSQ